MPNPDNEPQLPKNQSPIVDDRTGLVSRDWYRFFLNLLNKANQGGGGGSGTVTSVNVSGGSTGLTTSGGPVTTSGTITMAGTLNVANGGTGATTASGAQTNLNVPSTTGTGASGTWGISVTGNAANVTGTVAIANGGTGATTASGARTNLGAAASGANSDITSMSGITGGISTPQFIQMDDGTGQALMAGKMWYTPATGAWNLGMGNGNITQQVGEELFVYGKATAAITDSPLQIVYHTGTVGASGVITFAPTIAGITDINAIVGVATENIALNGFGRVTNFGVVHGITTNGTAFGETWADDDVIWYNPVTGNPTKFEPTAPNIKVQVGIVITAGPGGSGSFQVRLRPGSVLGGTDSNVQFSSLANKDLIQYDSALQYWKNVTPGSVTGVGSVANALTAGTGISYSVGTTYNGSVAVTINNSAPDQTVSLTGGTGISTSGTYPNFTITNTLPMTYPGAGIPNSTGTAWGTSYSTTGSGTVVALATSPSFTTPILGTPQSGNFSTGTFTWPTFNQNTTGTASNVTGTVAIANGGTGQTTKTPAFDALSPTTTKGDLIINNGTNNVRQAVGADGYVLQADSTQTTGVKWAATATNTIAISNDTSTASNLYPAFAAATTGSVSTLYTGNAKLLYKPSTGELTSTAVVASNGIFVNSLTIGTSYTIAAGYSGVSAGTVTISSGVTVTVSSGSRWVVV